MAEITSHKSYLVLGVEQLQLVVHQRVLGTLLLPQRSLLLQLRAPEGLDGVHGGAELLVGQLQLLLEVGQVALQVGVGRLQLLQVVGRHVGISDSDRIWRQSSISMCHRVSPCVQPIVRVQHGIPTTI